MKVDNQDINSSPQQNNSHMKNNDLHIKKNQQNETNEDQINIPQILNNNEKNSKKQMILKITLFLFFVGIITLIIIFRSELLDEYKNFINWFIKNKIIGFILIVLIYMIGTIFFFPGLILSLGAGYSFYEAYDNKLGLALFLGSLAVFFGALLGSMLAFLIARYLLRSYIQKKAQKWKITKALDQAIDKNGLQICLLSRLSPIIPFNFFNYFCGITGLKFYQYNISSFAMIPGIILYVYFGTLISNISDVINGDFEQGTLYIVVFIIGAVLGIIVLTLIIIKAKKELNQIIKQQEKEQKEKEQLKELENEQKFEENINQIEYNQQQDLKIQLE
ncbi:hypothetical protein PPERSA_03171 [Pseudocohnilembus persalinus]|uniref:VTT domain-containing protein n=1 Tax=Pseudocohnilembus persalinus TaxID=266149 RepID=A0A0V0QE64_PSEPJ|nr:hypothetical protein PPERSA_03171 [Pseudocohnilembus persalinus]|eukprot:KRX00438.1 hypothetical protein PPERSA_03171 [Pseudocohnilembus persalinus]